MIIDLYYVYLFKRDTESVVAGKLLRAWPDTACASEDGQYSDDGHDGGDGDGDSDGDGDIDNYLLRVRKISVSIVSHSGL